MEQSIFWVGMLGGLVLAVAWLAALVSFWDLVRYLPANRKRRAYAVLVLGFVGWLGILVGAIGLLCAALWAASSVLIAREAGLVRVSHDRFSRILRPLISALATEAVGALVAAAAITLSLVILVSTGEAFRDPNPFYSALAAQYGLSVLAVGIAGVAASRSLSRRAEQAPQPDAPKVGAQ